MSEEKPRAKKAERGSSPLWNRALERYRDELDESDDYAEILAGAGSMQDVLTYAKSFEDDLPRERTTLNSLNRLGPNLKFVDDLAAVIAVCFGADPKLTAFVWGSIRLILNLASSAGETLRNVLDMLEELSLTLPKFRGYEQSLPMEKALESSLLNVYTEVICFYARAIQFFRSHPNIIVQRRAWDEFQSDFRQTLKRIRRMSSTVESEADIARMRMDTDKYREVLDLMKDFKDSKISNDESIVQCYHVPPEANPRFWGRDSALHRVKLALNPNRNTVGLRTFALYGMGGVGKTQTALQYAEQNRDLYDSVLWVSADTAISMGQSTRDIAQALGLVKNEEELRDTFGSILKLKNWLREPHGHWLLVLDNADDLELLNQVWPNGATGSILITSRDFNVANHPAAAGFHVEPFDYPSGSQVLLQLLCLDVTNTANQATAKAIAEMLGGLPLALNQIASFISQRKISLHDFLPLYERNFKKIDAKKSRLTQYEHTLSTVWDISLSRLSGSSAHLQKLMALFHPDGINENMLCEGSSLVTDTDLDFLSDEMDLSDAEEILLQMALIEKVIEDKTLSVHRLVQSAVLRRLSDQDRTKYFDIAVQILGYGFGETWDKGTGHLFKAWTEDAWSRQEMCLPHVVHLVQQSERHQIRAGNLQKYGELLLRCTSYLYQKEYFDVAIGLLDVALTCFGDENTLPFAKATILRGQIVLNLHEPEKALGPFNEALRIHQELLAADDPVIAWGYNNLGITYTELSDFEKALENHEKAIKIRLSTDPERIGNSYSNMSSLCLRMGKVMEAEAYLYKCPALKDFTDETFLNTNNPRFAGDMVLLSRIRRAQGRADDAMRLATKALAFRRKLLGNRLTTCDAQYNVADVLHHHGNLGPSATMLEELVVIAESLPGGEGQLARANYKLSILYSELDRTAESEACRQRAVELRTKFRPEEHDAPFDEESFMKLCPWMLW